MLTESVAKYNPEQRKTLSTTFNLKRVLGWLPALVGLATWILAISYPRAQAQFFLLGLITSIAISVILHELAHFVAGRLLGLCPWWINIGHGQVLFEKQFRNLRLTLKEFPYSGAVFPLVAEDGQSRTPWRMLAMVAAGPVANLILLAAFWVNTPPLNALNFSNWQLIFWEMCLANAYLALICLLPFSQKMDGVNTPNDALWFMLLLVGHWRPTWAKKLRQRHALGESQGSWRWAVEQVNPEALIRVYREQLTNQNLSQHERALILDGFSTCVLMYGAQEYLSEADRYSHELLQIKPNEWTVKGTRGSVLVEVGKLELGMKMLLELMEHDPSSFDRAISASFLALGEFKKNDRESARKWLRLAHDLDPDCPSARRVQLLLDQENSTNDSSV